jgi:nitrogen-specific signal transduction histidine kinase/ActR/RegA family two-component response regulator
MATRGDSPSSPGSQARPRPDRLLQEALEAVGDGVAVFDENASLVFCNRAFRDLNPALSDFVVPGLAWEMLIREMGQRGSISNSAAERLRWMEARLAEGAETVPPLELPSPTGGVHEVSMRQSTSGGFIFLQRDITQSKQLEVGGEQADALLTKVLEACPANVVMSRIGDGQILYRSPAATELLGNLRCYYDYLANREERADFITALLPDGRVDDIRITGIRPDGTRIPCSVSARVIDYRGEDVVVSSTTDISKELDLQQRLVRQREQIFQAEKLSALGELLAGVAHELNNPLSVVVGHALMMRDETSDRETLRRIGKISDAAERCARIVKSFLAMARQLPARLAPMQLADTVNAAVQALRQSPSGLATPVNVQLPVDLPNILGDADQIEQVFINLIANADQAISSTGGDGRITIAARFDKAANMVEIRVCDDGPGIPANIRSRVFDPLFTTKEIGKGTGIGLAFCHRVAVSHKGEIRLEPASGKGATFVLRLPATGQEPGAADGPVDTVRGAPRAQVLVVDDEIDVAELIREILERDGFRVDHATSAEAALQQLATRDYTFVLTDLNMPGLGGRGFYEAATRKYPRLGQRIGFVTGDTMSPSARTFLDGTARPFLEKPIAPAELRALAQRMADEALMEGGQE